MTREQPGSGSVGRDRTATAGQAASGAQDSLREAEVSSDVELLRAVGNRTRYETLRTIARADGALCVCEIEPTLEVSQGAVSQALTRLTAAGLLEREKRGRWRYYEQSERADRLLNALDDIRRRNAI